MLSNQEIQVIRDNQLKSIAHKTLTPEQLALVYVNNWFNIWVPTEVGGKSLTLTDGTALLEELAYWDGSFAWTVTLCSGANMFAGFIDPTVGKEVFSSPKVCFGGSGRVGGKAVWDGERYHISGVWQYATGAPHLTHFTLNCFIFHGDSQQYNEDGEALVYSFFVPREHVVIHYDWDTFGLESTASHSFSLDHVPIDARYSFQIQPERRFYDEALFRIPFMPFAEVTLLVNYVGMYRRFLDLVEKFFFEKSQDPQWADQYSKSRFRLLDADQRVLEEKRNKMHSLIAQLWEVSVADDDPTQQEEIIREISFFSRETVSIVRNQVVQLFPLVGITGAQREHELNIVFRNIFTATQHSLLNTDGSGTDYGDEKG